MRETRRSEPTAAGTMGSPVPSPGRRAADSATRPLLGLAVSLLLVLCPSVGATPDWSLIEQTIIGEAASEGYSGMYAVACVMRNRRWILNGFSASRRIDLSRFVASQPPAVRACAERALRAVRAGGRDATHGATHYENVRAFGTPRWAVGLQALAQIGRHTFYRIEHDSP